MFINAFLDVSRVSLEQIERMLNIVRDRFPQQSGFNLRAPLILFKCLDLADIYMYQITFIVITGDPF
jgi:hypothetical protein